MSYALLYTPRLLQMRRILLCVLCPSIYERAHVLKSRHLAGAAYTRICVSYVLLYIYGAHMPTHSYICVILYLGISWQNTCVD